MSATALASGTSRDLLFERIRKAFAAKQIIRIGGAVFTATSEVKQALKKQGDDWLNRVADEADRLTAELAKAAAAAAAARAKNR